VRGNQHHAVEYRMTTLQLFLYILIGIFVQIALFALVAVLRHFRSYRFLQSRLAGLDTPPPTEPVLKEVKDILPDVLTGTTPPGKRAPAVKVARRLLCSFYLKHTDGGPLPDYKPGQFLTFQLTVRDTMTDGPKNSVSCYSL